MGEDTTLGDMPSPAADVLGSLIDDSPHEADAGEVTDCGDVATVVVDGLTGRYVITCVRVPKSDGS